MVVMRLCCFFFFKQKTAYEMRISDWSSDVCSSDLDSWWGAVHRVLDGAIDCASITWTLFDLSLPEWSLLFFLAVSIVMSYLLLRLVWNALIRPLSGTTSQLVRGMG